MRTKFDAYMDDLIPRPTYTTIDFCDFTYGENGSFMFRVKSWIYGERGEHELCQIWPDDPDFPMLLVSVERRVDKRKGEIHQFAVYTGSNGKLVVTDADPGKMMVARWEHEFYSWAFCKALEKHMKKRSK